MCHAQLLCSAMFVLSFTRADTKEHMLYATLLDVMPQGFGINEYSIWLLELINCVLKGCWTQAPAAERMLGISTCGSMGCWTAAPAAERTLGVSTCNPMGRWTQAPAF